MVNHYIRVDPELLAELKSVLLVSGAFLRSRPTYLDKIAQLKLLDSVNSRVEREMQRQFSQLVTALSDSFQRRHGFMDPLTINPDEEAIALLHDSFDIRKKIDNMTIQFETVSR